MSLAVLNAARHAREKLPFQKVVLGLEMDREEGSQPRPLR